MEKKIIPDDYLPYYGIRSLHLLRDLPPVINVWPYFDKQNLKFPFVCPSNIIKYSSGWSIGCPWPKSVGSEGRGPLISLWKVSISCSGQLTSVIDGLCLLQEFCFVIFIRAPCHSLFLPCSFSVSWNTKGGNMKTMCLSFFYAVILWRITWIQ